MKFQSLEKLLDDFIKLGIPGVDCAVYYHGKQVFRHMQGLADVEAKRPVDEDTIFQAFSVTKLLTATAVMKLYEEGKFLLDDPLWWYLPEYEHMSVKRPDGSVTPAERKIEIWHLLSMSAGCTFGASKETQAKVLAATNGQAPTREVVREFSHEPLLFEPGDGWFYGFCHDVLGALVEELSGMRFSDYCKKYILDPLGLEDMYFTVPEEKRDRLAATYVYEKETRSVKRVDANALPVQIGPEYESGGAGLFCTVSDYVRFADALCRGRILAPCTVDLMRTNVLTEKQLTFFRASREPGVRVASERKGYGYGLGVRTMIDRVDGGSNGSIGEFGWGGAAGAYVMMDPKEELTLFFEQQTLCPPAEYTRSRLRNVTYACLGKE